MADQSSQTSNQAFFESSLAPSEIEQILRRIDENLALRMAISASSGPSADGTPAALPEFGEVYTRLEEIRRLGELLYVTNGRQAQSFARRLINMPIKLLMRKQIFHNRETYAILAALIAQIEALRQYTMYSATLVKQAQQASSGLDEIRAAQAELRSDVEARVKTIEGSRRWFEATTGDVSNAVQHARRIDETVQQQGRWLEQLANESKGTQAWLKHVASDQRAQAEWAEILSKKMAMLALDLRESIASSEGDATLPEPRILDPEEYQRRIDSMNGDIRVNLGAGEKPLPEYINVDFRAVPGVDIVADVRKLPFDPASLTEIASAHLIEHFREHQMQRSILPYWRSLLRPDGVLRITCPDWAAMQQRLSDGRMTLAEYKRLTFGAQDYLGDDHFAMYTPETLSDLLVSAGFATPAIIATDRVRGGCPEMELVAHVRDG